MTESIKLRYDLVIERIEKACLQSGRKKEEVKLVVVTKKQNAESIIEVVNAGATILGENYPEETVIKIEEIGNRVTPTWHMIGHLQSRKIKLIYPSFSCIHSIDSLELAQKLNRFYEEKNISIDVLLEVNIAGEESKFGFDASSEPKREDLAATIESICELSHIKPIGLMTMPPYANEPAQNEACYNLCYKFCENIRKQSGLSEFRQLSMGTSADFETAIKCGATYIRIGEAIMGKRLYPEKK
ncbi:MAG: YggS family pyridoxal phosphate-dependent enzyme [Anaerolinea sp.]|nr:YggS family pyridoxal phosphate-dependent enzyme [Anaerolinea sp.]